MCDRYINTFLADKSDLVKDDLNYILKLSKSHNFDNNIISEFMLINKQLRFSYRVFGSFMRGKNKLEIILIGRDVISITIGYDIFIKYYRNEILNRLIE